MSWYAIKKLLTHLPTLNILLHRNIAFTRGNRCRNRSVRRSFLQLRRRSPRANGLWWGRPDPTASDVTAVLFIGISGESRLQCQLSRCFSDDHTSQHQAVSPRCRSPRYVHITGLIFGVLATRRCAQAYNSCCIDEVNDTWDIYRPQQHLFVNLTRLCDGRRHCRVVIDRVNITSLGHLHSADYVIVRFDCVTNDSTGTSLWQRSRQQQQQQQQRNVKKTPLWSRLGLRILTHQLKVWYNLSVESSQNLIHDLLFLPIATIESRVS